MNKLTWLSVKGIQVSAHPILQPLTLVVCVLWLQFGPSVDLLTNILSIWAIVLSLMILTDAKLKEDAEERRDKAMHAKLDELIKATDGARDEIEHLEDRPVDEIEAKRD